jgi:hypothetical protein
MGGVRANLYIAGEMTSERIWVTGFLLLAVFAIHTCDIYTQSYFMASGSSFNGSFLLRSTPWSLLYLDFVSVVTLSARIATAPNPFLIFA